MRRYIPLIWVSVFVVVFAVIATTLLAGHAGDPGPDKMKSITLYTTQPVEQVALLAQEYERYEGIRVNVVPLTPQDLTTRLIAERNSPQADIVLALGSQLDQLKREALLQPYASEQTDLVPDRFKDDDDNWIGIWFDPIIWAINSDYLKKHPAPAKWEELNRDPEVRVGITDFLASDASANLLYTFTGVNGEAATMEFLGKLHPHIIQYAKFLVTPVRMAGMGECDLAIAVNSEAVRYVNDGFPIKIVYPKDGTAFLVTGAGLVKNGRHEDDTRRFLDWLITDHAMYTLQRARYYFIPTSPELDSYQDYNAKELKLLIPEHPVSAADQPKLLDKWVHLVRLGAK